MLVNAQKAVAEGIDLDLVRPGSAQDEETIQLIRMLQAEKRKAEAEAAVPEFTGLKTRANILQWERDKANAAVAAKEEKARQVKIARQIAAEKAAAMATLAIDALLSHEVRVFRIEF